MKNRIIFDAITEWCKEQNAEKNSLKIAFAAASLICVCIAIGALTPMKPAAWIAGISIIIIWILRGPRIEMVGRLLQEGNRYVPDALLLKLAEKDGIPPFAKEHIAKALKDEGYVTFEFLFELDRQLANLKWHEDHSKGEGFKKMISHNPEQTERQ